MHDLLSYNVIGCLEYINRYNGFNGELHFAKWFRTKTDYARAEGGIFIPLVKTEDSFEQSIYVLVVNHDDYTKHSDFYLKQLEKAKKSAAKGQYLVCYNNNEPIENWKKVIRKGKFGAKTAVIYPSSINFRKYESGSLSTLTLSEFEKDTNISPAFPKKAKIENFIKEHFIQKLSEYEYEDIYHTYVTRFVLDGIFTSLKLVKDEETGYLNEVHQRGAPLDVDTFAKGSDGKWSIFEVKEKDLSGNGCFGMDVRRINSLFKLSNIFDMKAFYLVRHIDTQESRNFVDWQIISMNTFDRFAPSKVINGGSGMRGQGTDNPTRLCKAKYFKPL